MAAAAQAQRCGKGCCQSPLPELCATTLPLTWTSLRKSSAWMSPRSQRLRAAPGAHLEVEDGEERAAAEEREGAKEDADADADAVGEQEGLAEPGEGVRAARVAAAAAAAAAAFVVREARPEEYWQVAETHCASFYPAAGFPLGALLQGDRRGARPAGVAFGVGLRLTSSTQAEQLALLRAKPKTACPNDSGFLLLLKVLVLLSHLSLPDGVRKRCLVAVDGRGGGAAVAGNVGEHEAAPAAGFNAERDVGSGRLLRPLLAALSVGFPPLRLPLGPAAAAERECLQLIAGSVTVDTAAEFLPRRQPGNTRRTGIAYISNMAVAAGRRRRGAARRLLRTAEALARSWGCRAAALHVDVANSAAAALYAAEGYRAVRPPPGAGWAQPNPGPGVELRLMLKRLQPLNTAAVGR
eukprot:SM000094S24699  [mRNA]  locus=s94:337774:340345:+ [translate_table: standard]